MKKRRKLLVTLGAGTLVAPGIAQAQTSAPRTLRQIGMLTTAPG